MKLFLIFLVALFSSGCFAQSSNTAISTFDIDSKSDIDKIINEIGNKRIVAIGEDTHGTKEYYELRSAITKKLIKERGFNVFILENPFEDMTALQEHLFSEPIDTLMSKYLFSIYQTKEMKTFLIWLKAHARTHRVKITGCDDSYREILPGMLKKELKKYNDTVLDKLALEFEQRQLMTDIADFYTLPGRVKPDSLPDDTHFGYETYNLLLKLDSLYNLKKVKNVTIEELLFHAISNYDVYWGLVNKKYLSRDAAMGNRVNFYAKDKNAKIIIWANSGHIVKKSLNIEIGKMGETIAAKNPNQYFSIGLCTSKGNYSYLKNNFINDDHIYNDTLFNSQLEDVNKTSWNSSFELQKQNNYLINFSKASKSEILLYSTVKPLRFVGYRKENPLKVYYNTDPFSKFDMIVFIRHTNHTTSLFY